MDLLAVASLTVIASLIGTLTGFGLSTILIPALVFFMPTIETILLVSVVHWFGNLWKIGFFRSGLRPKLIALFGAGGVVASWLGALLAVSSGLPLLRILGALLIAHAGMLLFRPKVKLPASDTTALAGGAVSGFIAGLTGIGGPTRGAFLALFDLPKAAYLATAGAIGLIVDTSRIAAYHLEGVRLSAAVLAGLPILIAASFLGAALAKPLVDRIPQARFRTVVAIFLALVGAKLLISP